MRIASCCLDRVSCPRIPFVRLLHLSKQRPITIISQGPDIDDVGSAYRKVEHSSDVEADEICLAGSEEIQEKFVPPLLLGDEPILPAVGHREAIHTSSTTERLHGYILGRSNILDDVWVWVHAR